MQLLLGGSYAAITAEVYAPVLYRCACFYCANTLPDFSPPSLLLLVYDDEANYLASYRETGWVGWYFIKHLWRYLAI